MWSNSSASSTGQGSSATGSASSPDDADSPRVLEDASARMPMGLSPRFRFLSMPFMSAMEGKYEALVERYK
eukprot:8981566-Alexandrium_andersonii.AAC.1